MAISDIYKVKRQILIVDDQEINRDLLGVFLEDEYELLYAENGKIAMDIIRENKDKLSLVLLDLMMPVMDGFEVMERMQADDSLRRIPVIVLTAEKSAEVKSLNMGALDFITKPFDSQEVIQARISRIIELYESTSIIESAEKDNLTGLYAWKFFLEYASQMDRYHPDMKTDALALNIDRFHLVNELYGREFGDRVLKLLAKKINQALEGSDGLACRRDADMYYVYCSSQADYEKILEKVQRGVSAISDAANIHIRLGVYPDTDHSMPMQRRFERARSACTKIRGNYSQSIMIYDDEMHAKEVFSENLINGIHQAVSEKQFKVFYQPKYNITGEKPYLCSAEALIRWVHPEYGMVSPGAFIPLFEDNGLIQVVDNFVWREAAAQVRKWKEEYGVTVPVSVNLSRVDIYDPELEQKLEDLLDINDITPKELKLEVTESAYAEDAKKLIETVQRLRDKGFEIEMDDFGSGYSSLNMISSLPIDVLKMDMKFIQNVRSGVDKDMHMIELVLDIARYLNVPVVAEGVETAEEVQLLHDIGCDIIQGYYFSKPVPPEEFVNFFGEGA